MFCAVIILFINSLIIFFLQIFVIVPELITLCSCHIHSSIYFCAIIVLRSFQAKRAAFVEQDVGCNLDWWWGSFNARAAESPSIWIEVTGLFHEIKHMFILICLALKDIRKWRNYIMFRLLSTHSRKMDYSFAYSIIIRRHITRIRTFLTTLISE